jgi:putative membrane protein
MRRTLLFAGCLGTLAISWGGLLPALLTGPFAAHMAVHMAVVAIAAPLGALALSGGRFDPMRSAPALFSALLASVLELVVVWAWHTPALHHLARHSRLGLALEQGMFFAAGLYLWLAAVGAPPGVSVERAAAGVIALLLTSMHMTLLGALLALAPRPLFAHGGASGADSSVLSDQELGGAIMLLVGGIAYLAGGVALGARIVVTPWASRRLAQPPGRERQQ